VTMMKRTLELETLTGVNVRGLLTWAFLFDNTPYFAGYRTLTTNGIHLPVLNAFKLLGKLDGTRLPVASTGSLTLDEILSNSVHGVADVDAMATRNGNQVSVLVWNYHDALVAAPVTPIHMTVTVPAGFGSRAWVSRLRVDDTHGDAYPVWVSQGSPPAPNAAQIAALKQAMEPSPVETAGSIGVADGSVNIDFTLPRFGISLITLTPAGDAGPPTLDARKDLRLVPSGGGCACRFAASNASSSTHSALLALLVGAALRRRKRGASLSPSGEGSRYAPFRSSVR